MDNARMKFANLNEKEMQKVHVLEEQMNGVVLVMERFPPPARLDETQIQRLQALERELGVVLIAYQKL